MNENKRNYTLDLIRGVSAMIVMSGHLRSALFKDFTELDSGYSASLIEKGFYFITSLGHQAVMVFFVLSGYFVGGSVLKAKNNFSFKNYLIARLSRLWTPLFPILLLTIIIDYFTGIVSNEILVGNHFSTLMSGPNGDYSSSPITFISNMLFLQTVYTPVYGSNGPLWSLANEFWYYILFPLLMGLMGFTSQNRNKRVVYGVITLLIIVFVSSNMMLGFMIWVMGALVYLITKKKVIIFNIWFFAFSLVLFIFSLVGSKVNILGNFYTTYSDVFIGFTFSIFLLSVINSRIPNFSFINLRKISFWISEISYTLYIVHFPIVLLIYSLYYSDNQLFFNGTSILQYLTWLVLIIFLSVVMWYLFERKTPFIRNQLKKLVKDI